ncbi:KH domain-containing protein akap-1 [Venturia canescens]|uniref:KH domain-containing protein akap-1 n=1 Tax=Venturia canescens TaxID=32260 RepID=UPI001C9D5C65|nr:KH domain-containing protein akap-1 [Venturia canescens]XP_043270002.1 KH domain-containing protein akap-1 [Venturia canescens]XP_043270003.1 KH domain-containing protein akap-1 [Venturia canescens]
MSARNIQLVKWTIPAFAFIVGFFWYKRRRVDRVDPGGVNKLKGEIDDIKQDCKNNTKADKGHLNLYDSGIHIDESYALNTSSSNSETSQHCTPRRVSQSLDIPTRRSGSQQISIQSGKSLEDKEPCWYESPDDEVIKPCQAIVLGSNPKSTNFDMSDSMRDMMGKKSLKSRENADAKILQTFENVTEEEEAASAVIPSSALAVQAGNNKPVAISESRHQTNISDPKVQGQVICERDSANHSPVSGVLEGGSVTDEVRSEGSTDSGKGGSIKGHAKDNNPTSYEFAVPQTLVGRLIGKRGAFLHDINTQTGVHVCVKRHPLSKESKICLITGTPDCIKAALKMIRHKFPTKKFPSVTLEEISILRNPEEISWVSELMHLSLVEGVNNDITVCHILKPNRLFVQLPTHPTYPSLRILDQNMTQHYDTIESPPVPDQLSKGMLVVAKCYDRWVRAYVENPDPNGQQNLVRLVDHGGYWTFSNGEMRKIRSDYLTLPFQAIEVFLAHIRPVNGEWKQEAYDVVAQMCSGSIGQAQIEGYIDSNIYVSLYLNIQKHGVISLADELIARGFAVPVALDEVAPEEHLPTA